jgi:preprotein translocase subunit SecE
MINLIKKLIQFIKESYSELNKVSWLTYKELLGSTVVIIIFILLSAVFIGLVDFVLAKILGTFLIR